MKEEQPITPPEPQQPPTNPYARQPGQPGDMPSARPEWQTQTPEPLPQPHDAPFVPPLLDPSKYDKPKRKKGLIIGIIVGVVVLLAAIAGAVYAFWYQNPNKVVADSVMNLVQAKSMTYKTTLTGKDGTFKNIEITGQFNNENGTGNADVKVAFKASATSDVTINASGVLDDKGDLYIKVKNIDELLQSRRESTELDQRVVIDNFTQKVNDKWVKVAAEDIQQVSGPVSKSQNCLEQAAKKLREDKNLSSEITELYKKHPFITITDELGIKDGSMGYVIDEDRAKTAEFTKGLKETQVYKTLYECDKEFEINEEDLSAKVDQETDGSKIEVWVSQWSHELTKISVTADPAKEDSFTSAVFEPIFNTQVTVTTPESSKTITEVVQDFQTMQTEMMQLQMKKGGVAQPSPFSES